MKQKKEEQIHIYVTKEIKERWSREADLSGLTLSGWIRTSLLMGSRSQAPLKQSYYNGGKKFTTGKRVLPLIPGSKEWRKEELKNAKIAMITELKTVLNKNRKQIEEEK